MHTTAVALRVLLALTVASSGCASTAANSMTGGTGNSVRRDPNVLLADEIQAGALGDARLLEAIRRLRPRFLTPQGGAERGGTMQVVQVALNGGVPGPLSLLDDLPASSAASVTLLTPDQVAVRYGLRDVFGPVLVVTLR